MPSATPQRHGRARWLRPVLFLVLFFAVIWLSSITIIDGVPRAPSTAVGRLRALSWALRDYRSTHYSYPDTWHVDMSGHLEKIRRKLDEFVHRPPDFMFELDLQSSAKPVEAYLYRYTPLPTGCVEPHCSGYTLTATPSPQYSTYRSFVIDESGTIRHCVGNAGADAADPTINEAPVAC